MHVGNERIENKFTPLIGPINVCEYVYDSLSHIIYLFQKNTSLEILLNLVELENACKKILNFSVVQ